MKRIRTCFAIVLVVLAASPLASTEVHAAPGDLDSIFSGNWTQVTDFGGDEGAGGVVVQGDGKIVVAGGADVDFALARYNVDGSLDTAFSDDGKQTTDLGGNDGAWGVALQDDGKLVVAGGVVAAGRADGDFALARYSTNGSLDESFGVGGKVITDLRGGSRDGATGVAIQDDGKIVVAGSSVAAGSSDSDFALARYNAADGSLDTSFGAGGKQITDLGSDIDEAWGVATHGGKIVVAGRTVPAGSDDSDFALARYNAADGSLDTSFNAGGQQTTDFGGGDFSQDIAIQAEGKIVAAGSSLPNVPTSDFGDFALARYDANGSLDTSFGVGGKQTTSLDVEDYGWAVAIQADGRIVVAGRSAPDFTIGGPDFGLARYDTNGSLDTTFFGDGKQTTDFGGTDDWALSVALQPDGHIVVAGGTSSFDTGFDFALARYQDGSAPSPPGGAAPTNSSLPTISGSATDGQTPTVNAGTWSGSSPIEPTYQWRRCDWAGANCADITAATATTYTLTAADVGHTIRVRETATNAYGQSSVDSAATAAVKPRPGAIAGSVRATNGAAIANASVGCGNGYSAKTASDGSYSIPNVAPAKYSCTASANGYRPSTQTVTVTSGQPTTANFKLRR